MTKMMELFSELTKRFPFASIILNADILTVQQIDNKCIACGKENCDGMENIASICYSGKGLTS